MCTEVSHIPPVVLSREKACQQYAKRSEVVSYLVVLQQFVTVEELGRPLAKTVGERKDDVRQS